MSRIDDLLAGADPSWSILEIGPSHAPIAPRSGGWNTTVVDYTTRDGLLAKFSEDAATDRARIEEVDIVWTGGRLDEAVPADQHGRFDLLIASHAIEHFPDPIGVLRSAEVILKPGTGMVSLAVPDKRLCFDVFRPPSSTGKLLAAHHDQRQRHSRADVFDSEAYYAMRGNSGAWDWHEAGAVTLRNDLAYAKRAYDSTQEAPGSDYRDCHAWMFTPASFELAILEIAELGLIDWRVDRMMPQPGIEFLVLLRRGRERFASAEALAERRLELLHRMAADIEAGAKAFLNPEPPPKPEPEPPPEPDPAPEPEPEPASPPEKVTLAQTIWRAVTPVALRAALARLRGRA